MTERIAIKLDPRFVFSKTIGNSPKVLEAHLGRTVLLPSGQTFEIREVVKLVGKKSNPR